MKQKRTHVRWKRIVNGFCNCAAEKMHRDKEKRAMESGYHEQDGMQC